MEKQKGAGTAGCITVLRIAAVILAGILLIRGTGYVGLIIIIVIFIALGVTANIAKHI